MKFNPVMGSPPTPMQVDWPIWFFVRLSAISYVKVPLLEATPTFPGVKTCAGIIPTLHFPGVIIPGVFGPIMVAFAWRAWATSSTESRIGICSVIITIIWIPLSIASSAASAAKGAGTKIIDAFAACFSCASLTVS